MRDRWTHGGAAALVAVLLLLGLAAFADRPASVVASALAAVVVAFLVSAAQPTVDRSAQVRATSLRQRARHAGVPSLRDPDAPGRPRPRAPSA